MTKPEYHSFAIFPALNVARLGNADDYYIGSEIPGVYVGKGHSEFNFKDKKGRIKPQAARFRIYGYDENGKNLGEIELKNGVEITWTVVLANKKAAHMGFFGIKNQDLKGPIRNADWPYDRSTLTAIREKSLTSVSGNPPEPAELKARVFRRNIKDEDAENNKDGHELYLGKIIMEKEGSLLIIGGKGESGSVVERPYIVDYANNDYWYDDTSDGSLDAKVTINGKSLQNREGKSWVLVAPPKYAPGIPNIVSLYQTISETQHSVEDNPIIDPVIPETERAKVDYYRDIYPIFEAICRNSWVNVMGHRGHGPNKPGNFLNPGLEDKLKQPGPKHGDLRKSILSRVRVPAKLASSYEYNGQAYDYFMPPLSGDDGDADPGNPDTYLTITPGQYLLLQKWVDGNFVEGTKPPQYNIIYKYDSGNSKQQPTYSNDNGKTYLSFQEMFQKIFPSQETSQQVKFLNKAALEWCVGGPFFPGIEMTYIAYYKKTFHEKHDFRINSNMIQPGDINAYMALPWQADFNECNTNWWPAQRPDIAISEVETLREIGNMKVQLKDTPIKDQATKKKIILTIDKIIEMKQINWQDIEDIKKNMEKITNGNETSDVIEIINKMIKKMNTLIKEMGHMHFVKWTRGFRGQNDIPVWGDMDMVGLWNRLGFIIEKQIPNNINAFVEIERGDIYERNIKDIKDEDYTLNNINMLVLHTRSNSALQIELSTIPPYLYAMYSIKRNDEIFDITDVITYNIRHVVAEEMLHASLVANLIAAIGCKPVFYSPEMIPTYPNPLPHVKQGQLMVHLSKADVENFDTFICIEEPSPLQAPPRAPRLPIPSPIPSPPDFPININSIGELYKVIEQFFTKLDKLIPYNTEFQLEPGMGYAPSTGTGENGLIVVSKLKEAQRAIELIIDQGEGKPRQSEMIITKGIIDGRISGEFRVEDGETIFEGMFEGSVDGSIKKIESKETGTVKGKIEKARIEGTAKNDKINGKIIEGIIKGNTNFKSEGDLTIERIIEEGSFEIDHKNIGEGIKFEKRIKNVQFNNGSIDEISHYIIHSEFVRSYENKPKIATTANAFNTAYSYLMLLLQNAWRTSNQQKEEEKKTLVIGGMPALMHGILKPIATFLAETPISADTTAGATFGYHEFNGKSCLREQLIEAVKEASKAFPYSDKLKSAACVVDSLPDISLTI